jgi:hypothetical protein
MARCVPPVLLAFTAALCLTSCGFPGYPERPVWRAQAENACFARKQVTLSDAIVEAGEINGPGICGMTRPLKVSALDNGAIAIDKTLTIDCPMIPALEAWLNAIVEPDAQTRFGQRVATVKVFGAYSCRGIDNIPGAPSAMRSMSPASRSPTAGRSTSSATGSRPTPRKPPSCMKSTRAPANISRPS